MANDELKNLPPEERIKKLKELEQQKKKEIEEAHKLIQESEGEITEKAKQKEKIPIPAVAAASMDELTEAEKEVVSTHKGIKKNKVSQIEEEVKEKDEKKKVEDKKTKDSLEEMAREKVEIPPEVLQSDYTRFLSQKPIHDLYSEVTKINRAVEDKGYVSREEERRIEYLSSAVEQKINDIDAGRYTFSESAARAASAIQQVGSKIMSIYRRNGEEEDGQKGMYRG